MDLAKASASSTRKARFTPNAPKRRPPTRSSQSRSGEVDEGGEAELLLKHIQLQGQRDTTKKESSVRVSFGGGATTPTSTSGTGKAIRDGNSLRSGRFNLDVKQQIVSSSPAVESHEIGSIDETMKDVLSESNSEEEVYEEPWDCERRYYPTTLPMRRPNSGNPDIYDKAEFGEEYNEKKVNAAKELKLLDESERESLLFFQLPPTLPTLKGKEPAGQTSRGIGRRPCWEDLPAGYIGKLLVYNSGAVKLKLGETLYDVNPGSGEMCEHLMAMNYKSKVGCLLGQVEKHAVVSLDVDSILDGN